MDVSSYLLGKKSGGGGPAPTGTINITENGTHNVTNYASANVNVQPDLETKSVTITENTTTTITPTSGKDGLSSVSVTTNVSGGSVETLDDLNNILVPFIEEKESAPDRYETLSSETATLYTPLSSCQYYAICLDTNNKYKIFWFNSQYDYGIGISYSSSNNRYTLNSVNFTYGMNYITQKKEIYMSFQDATKRMSDSSYDTIEETILAIKDNTTTYSNPSESARRILDENAIILSNAYLFTSKNNQFLTAKKISSNETIQAI